ncbi:hypothetical protein PV08_09992 [Exophiala spinifera]|uniref:AB hydrolase-1 domain-containing protein n=1 Tax=Exophiala spinifera TaxID=91928 RepID=A0A0D2BNK5_9EURO|nr:uncharacterized protein PV08_09992 [Exophiala spinifera]KIW12714.1 hypothetical protein PV08_09992 [Exophiala spinifera]
MIPGAAVDHQIYALPTIKTNAVEYFQAAGYEVFCVTHWMGKTPNAQRGYTAYDARLDILASFEEIHRIHCSEQPIYVISHCMGSIALSAGLLDGTIKSAWIKGLTTSQVFFNPIAGTVNKLKAASPVPLTRVYRLLAGNWFSCISTENDTLVQRLFNQVLLWTHKRLNAATHDNLSKFLGGITMRALELLMFTGTHGYVVNNNRESLVTPANLQCLQGMPILFISGGENVVFSPEGTDKSFTTLTAVFALKDYEREVFDGYGHLDCWMGSQASKDVYPTVLAHAEKTYIDNFTG